MNKSKDTLLPLLDSIKKTINDVINDDMSKLDATGKYEVYLKQFKKLKKELKPGDRKDVLGGMLYNHNIYNFSKLTAIYSYNKNKLNYINSYGLKKYITKINNILNKNIKDVETNRIYSYILNQDGTTINHLYIYRLNFEGITLLIATVSSSYYFNKKMFIHLNNFIRKNIEIDINYKKPFILDYAGIISNKLYHLMMQDESTTFSVVIYDFIELSSFEHMSIQTLKNVSNYITMTLNEAYGEDTEILPLAIDKYIAIIDNRLINAHELANQTVAFNFNGLRLRRKIKRAEIDSEEQFYRFIDKLFYL